jgi:predicted nucleotidyltransferase component of viral defense system
MHAPWLQDAQVEQDLVITKALIQLYSDPHIAEAFAFRGGTAMQKLYYRKATRYSEDIDLVQVRKEKIGESIDVIRKIIDPRLGEPKRSVKQPALNLRHISQRSCRTPRFLLISSHFLFPVRPCLTR